MLNPAEEASLIDLAKVDGLAFAELYAQYFPRVRNYVQNRVNDTFEAEDLTSQIFERLYKSLESYQPDRAAFSCWIFCIARNAITDYYRFRIRHRTCSLEMGTEPQDRQPDPWDVASYHETQAFLRQALACLSEREREMILLKYWYDYSNREIAQRFEISESNTGVILFRSIRRLRKILQAWGNSGEFEMWPRV